MKNPLISKVEDCLARSELVSGYEWETAMTVEELKLKELRELQDALKELIAEKESQERNHTMLGGI